MEKMVFMKLTLFVVLVSTLVSCALRNPVPEKTSTAIAQEEESDAAADTALGTLEEPSETEAQKEAQKIGEQLETNRALRDLEQRRRREEEERLERTITSDDILKDQIDRG